MWEVLVTVTVLVRLNAKSGHAPPFLQKDHCRMESLGQALPMGSGIKPEAISSGLLPGSQGPFSESSCRRSCPSLDLGRAGIPAVSLQRAQGRVRWNSSMLKPGA